MQSSKPWPTFLVDDRCKNSEGHFKCSAAIQCTSKCWLASIPDLVNHPSHYGGDTTYEAIKVIEAWDLNFNLGNVLKYIKRLELKDKDAMEDLLKAQWYLQREIDRRKKPELYTEWNEKTHDV